MKQEDQRRKHSLPAAAADLRARQLRDIEASAEAQRSEAEAMRKYAGARCGRARGARAPLRAAVRRSCC
jgi:hypothetical protein